MSDFVQQQNSICDFATSDSWVILSPIEQSIKKKIESVGTPLKDWDINIYRGVLTGCNEAFIIDSKKRDEILANCQTEDERQRTAELIRPILRGRDIKRYGYDWANLYLIATFPSRHYDIDRYPAVKQYLLSFEEENLRNSGYEWVADNYLADFCKQKLAQTGKFIEIAGKRITIGNTPEKARKRTSNKWFETQDSISYWEDFSKQQIVWIELSDDPKFALAEKIMSVNTVFFMTGEHILHLLGLLNSRLITWYFRHCIGTTSGVGTNRWLKYTIEQIPMAPVSSKLKELSFLITKSYNEEKNQEIDLLVCRLYNLNEEEITYIISQ
ncbi:MAG: class I SAM-dependent DNA methyltransferase [Prevotella sp.]|nr:class I SAM-dependent DNA methyltransferase [Prevotella sp.]